MKELIENLRVSATKAAALDHNEGADWYPVEMLTAIPALSYAKNARFIAAASPTAVLDLFNTIERLENDKLEFARIYRVLDAHAAITEKANAQAEEFERKWYLACDERDALAQDAARYQWITKHIVSGELDNLEQAFAVFGDDESVTLEAFNSAIDAAMGGVK